MKFFVHPFTFYFSRRKKQHAHGRRRRGLGESMKKLINFFWHVIYHFCLAFDRKLIANNFKYLRDMLDSMVDVNVKDKEEFIKK